MGVPSIVDRRVVAPSGEEYRVVAMPIGDSDPLGRDWPEPVTWMSTAPGWIGIVDGLRHRVMFRGRWRVDVYTCDDGGTWHGPVSSEQARNRSAASERVAVLSGQLQAGTASST